jgi:hypothetical protein
MLRLGPGGVALPDLLQLHGDLLGPGPSPGHPGVRQSRFVVVGVGIPSSVSGQVVSRAVWRSTWAMLVVPVRRWVLMARLRRVAMARGAVPVRRREWSSR